MEQITVRMLRSVDGSLNGRDVRTYHEGLDYTLPDDGELGLAGVFLREEWAVRIDPSGQMMTRVSDPMQKNSLTPRRCVYLKADGEQCGGDAINDTGFCFNRVHQREGPAQVAARGGEG